MQFKTLLLCGVAVESVLVLEVGRNPANDFPTGACGANLHRTLHTLGICAVVFGLAGFIAAFMAAVSSLLLVIAGSLAVQSFRSAAGGSGSGSEARCCCCCSGATMRALLVVVCCVAPMQLIGSSILARHGATDLPEPFGFFFTCGTVVSSLHFVLAVVFTASLDSLHGSGRRGVFASASTPLIAK